MLTNDFFSCYNEGLEYPVHTNRISKLLELCLIKFAPRLKRIWDNLLYLNPKN